MKPFLLGVLGVLISLAAIATSITLSPWFSFMDNALSDLGHPSRSRVAPIFNTGLSTGGMLIFTASMALLGSRMYRILTAPTGYLLMLIGILNEGYGELYFFASIAFFALMPLLLVAYSVREGKPVYVVLAAASIILWYIHLEYRKPPGASIPELVSIVMAISPYISVIRGSGRRSLSYAWEIVVPSSSVRGLSSPAAWIV